MVEMKAVSSDSLSDKQRIDGAPVHLVDEWERGEAGMCWMDCQWQTNLLRHTQL